MLHCQAYGFLGIVGDAHNLHAGFEGEELEKAVDDAEVVVCDEKSDGVQLVSVIRVGALRGPGLHGRPLRHGQVHRHHKPPAPFERARTRLGQT